MQVFELARSRRLNLPFERKVQQLTCLATRHRWHRLVRIHPRELSTRPSALIRDHRHRPRQRQRHNQRYVLRFDRRLHPSRNSTGSDGVGANLVCWRKIYAYFSAIRLSRVIRPTRFALKSRYFYYQSRQNSRRSFASSRRCCSCAGVGGVSFSYW